jgi:hypothetical protein
MNTRKTSCFPGYLGPGYYEKPHILYNFRNNSSLTLSKTS